MPVDDEFTLRDLYTKADESHEELMDIMKDLRTRILAIRSDNAVHRWNVVKDKTYLRTISTRK